MRLSSILLAVVRILLLAVVGTVVRVAALDVAAVVVVCAVAAGVVVVRLLRCIVAGASVGAVGGVRVPAVLVAVLVVMAAAVRVGGGGYGCEVGLATVLCDRTVVKLGGLVGRSWLRFLTVGLLELSCSVGACGGGI